MASSSRRRPDQVAEVIRQVIAEALLHDVRDPRIELVTVTRVDVTPDLSRARVLVAVHGEATDQDRALEGLQSAEGFFRSRVAKAIRARTTPDLRFEIDRGLEHAAKIHRLLNELRREGDG